MIRKVLAYCLAVCMLLNLVPYIAYADDSMTESEEIGSEVTETDANVSDLTTTAVFYAPDAIDGVRESAWDNAEAIDISATVFNDTEGDLPTAQVWTMYSPAYLYAFAEVKDSSVNASLDNTSWDQDSVSFMLNFDYSTVEAGDHDVSYRDLGDDSYAGYITVPAVEGDYYEADGDTYFGVNTRTAKFIESCCTITDDGYNVEIRIPIPRDSEPGVKYGFEIQINDSGTSDSGRTGAAMWSPEHIDAWTCPACFGTLELGSYPERETTAVYGTPVSIDGGIGIDGIMDEGWENAEEIFVAAPTYINLGVENSEAKVYSMWDDEYLYFYAKVTDITPFAEEKDASWDQDAVCFTLNYDYSTVEAKDHDVSYRDLGEDSYAGYINVCPTDLDGTWYNVPDEGGIFAQLPYRNHINSYCVGTDYGYDVEIRIPLALYGDFDAGDKIGYEVCIDESIGLATRSGVVAWNPEGADTWDCPACFGTLILGDEPEAAATGDCGDDLTWKLMPGGKLVIEGTGKMWDFTEDEPMLTEEQRNSVTSLVINKGVTYIGTYAFGFCCYAEGDLIIPDGVTAIGEGAFIDCGFNYVLELPDSVTYIGAWAFGGCGSLGGELTIPDGVTYIGDCAFVGGQYDGEVVIPAGVEYLGISAFDSCSELTSVRFVVETAPVIGENVFQDMSSLEAVYVPAQSYNEYLDTLTDKVDISLIKYNLPRVDEIWLEDSVLYWTIPEGMTETSYFQIFRRTNFEETYSEYDSVSYDVDTYVDENAEDGAVYYYFIRVMDKNSAAIEAEDSEEVSQQRGYIEFSEIGEIFGGNPLDDDKAYAYENAFDGDADTAYLSAGAANDSAVGVILPEPAELEEVRIIPYISNGYSNIRVIDVSGEIYWDHPMKETADQLFDYNVNTEWVTYNPTGAYVIFALPESVSVTGYQMAIGTDTEQYPGRNPESWTIYGTNELNEVTLHGEWEVVTKVVGDETLENINCAVYDFEIDGEVPAYKYYKLVIDENEGSDVVQLSDFSLIYDGCYSYEKRDEIQGNLDRLEATKLQASIDGENWITLYRFHTEQGISPTEYEIKAEFMGNIVNEYAFTHFRLVSEDSEILISEIEFYGNETTELPAFPGMEEIEEPIYNYVPSNHILDFGNYNFEDYGYFWDDGNEETPNIYTADEAGLELLNSADVYINFEDGVEDVTGSYEVTVGGDVELVEGRFGNAGQFYSGEHFNNEGIANYAEIADLEFGSDSFTIATWVNVSELGGDPAIFGNKDWASGINDGFVLAMDDEKWRFNAKGEDRYDNTVWHSDSLAPEFEEWCHIAAVIDRENNEYRFYLNGVLMTQEDMSVLADYSLDCEYSFFIGQTGAEYNNSCHLAARYDDFAVFKRVLSEDEILSIYSYDGFIPVMIVGGITTPEAVLDADVFGGYYEARKVVGYAPFAFYNDQNINRIEAGESLRYICEEAFTFNGGLEEVVLNRNIRDIAHNAFLFCDRFAQFTVSYEEALTDEEKELQLGHYIEVADGFTYRDNVLLDFPDVLYEYDSFTVPDFIEYIAPEAFLGTAVSHIDFNNVVVIEDMACAYAEIESVRFGDTLEYIGQCAFADNPLTTVEFPASLNRVYSEAFVGCSLLESVTINSTDDFNEGSIEYPYDSILPVDEYGNVIPTVYLYQNSAAHEVADAAGWTYEFLDEEEAEHIHTMTYHAEKAATCTSVGNKAYWTCSGCADVIYGSEDGSVILDTAEIEVDSNNHTGNIVISDYKAASCTEDGYSGDEVFNCCNKVNKVGRKTAAKGHDESGEWMSNDALNSHYKNCSRCNEIILCAEHDGEATCTEGAHCSVCDITYAAPKGHNLVEHKENPASCTDTGLAAFWSCYDCGSLFADEEAKVPATENGLIIPAVGHEWGEWGEPDEDQIAVRECNNCDGSESRKVEERKLDGNENTVIHVYTPDSEDEEASTAAVEIVIPYNTMSALIENQTGNEKVTIDVSTVDTSANHVTISTDAVTTMTNEEDNTQSLEVQLSAGTVEFNNNALETLTGGEGSSVALEMGTTEVEDDNTDEFVENLAAQSMNNAQANTLNEMHNSGAAEIVAAVDVTLIDTTNNTHLGSNGFVDDEDEEPVTITIPFTIGDGKDGDRYKVVYIHEDGSREDIEAEFEPEYEGSRNGHLRFKVKHFSEFIVYYRYDADINGKSYDTFGAALDSIKDSAEVAVITLHLSEEETLDLSGYDVIAPFKLNLNGCDVTGVFNLPENYVVIKNGDTWNVTPKIAEKNIGVNVILENNFDMVFRFDKNFIDDWSGCYVEFTMEHTDDRGTVVSKVPVDKWDVKDPYYCATFEGIATKEMSENVTVVICDAEGTPISEKKIISIREYAVKILVQEGTGKEKELQKTMALDMLEYGAAAQIQFGYNTEDLANNLTEELQKKYNKDDVNIEELQQKYYDKDVVTEYQADTLYKGEKWRTANLILESNIKLLMLFLNVDETSATVDYEFINHYGDKVEVSDRKFIIDYENKGLDVLSIDELVVADARCPVTITIRDAVGNEIGKTIISIENYLALLKEQKDTGVEEALMKFSDSAYAYLHRNDQ